MSGKGYVDFEMINPPALAVVPEATVQIPMRKTVFTVVFVLSLIVGGVYAAVKYTDVNVFAQQTPVEGIVKSVEKAADFVAPVRTKKVKAAPAQPVRRKTDVGVDKATGIVIMGNVYQDEKGNWRLN